MDVLLVLYLPFTELIDSWPESRILNFLFIQLISNDLELMSCLLAMIVLIVQEFLKRPLLCTLHQYLRLKTTPFHLLVLLLPQLLRSLLLPYLILSVELICSGSTTNDRFQRLIRYPKQLLVQQFLAG